MTIPAPSPEHVADTHDSLVALLCDMPDDQLIHLITPLVGLHPGDIARVSKRDTSARLLGTGTKRPPRGLADLVIELHTHSGQCIRVVVIEVQLSFDARKLDTWPMLHTSIGVQSPVDTVDTYLLVLTPNAKLRGAIARRLLPRISPRPRLIEPDHIELICDYQIARTKAHTAILSGVVRSREPDSTVPLDTKIAALKAAYIALDTMHELDAHRYSALIDAISPTPLVKRARGELEEEGELTPSLADLVSETERGGHSFTLGHTEGRQEGLQQGRQEGLQRAQAHLRQAIIQVLQERAITPDTPLLTALEACDDIVHLSKVHGAASNLPLANIRALLSTRSSTPEDNL